MCWSNTSWFFLKGFLNTQASCNAFCCGTNIYLRLNFFGVQLKNIWVNIFPLKVFKDKCIHWCFQFVVGPFFSEAVSGSKNLSSFDWPNGGNGKKGKWFHFKTVKLLVQDLHDNKNIEHEEIVKFLLGVSMNSGRSVSFLMGFSLYCG